MASVNIKVNLITKAAELQLQKLNTNLKGVDRTTKRTARSVNTLSRSFRNASVAFGNFGILLRAGVVGGGLFALSQGVRKAIADFAAFETALVGVSKTTNLAGQELEEFGNQIINLSDEIPVSARELLNLSRIAAQLGVRGARNLEKFAEVGARLAVSTDLAAEDAVTSLTRILGVTQGSIEDVDKLGAALVGLGNTFKAQESEILTAAGRVARATAGFGVTAQQTLAIGAALKEAGVEAESGGSAVGRVFQEIAEALTNGGSQLERFTEITGLSADALRKQFAESSAETFKIFINGLSEANLSSEELTATLKELQLNNVRVAATIRPLVNINDRLNTSLEDSNQLFQDNAALLEESDKQFDTTAGRLNTLRNRIDNLFTAIGNLNSGPLNSLIKGLGDLAVNAREALAPDLNKRFKLLSSLIKGQQVTVESLQAQQKKLGDITLKNSKQYAELQLKIFGASQTLKGYKNDIQEVIKKLTGEGENFVGPSVLLDSPDAPDDPDPNNDPRVENERKVFNLLDLLRQDRQARQAELEEEEAALMVATQDERFGMFIEGLGREEAAEVASKARRLIEEKKFDQARALIADARRKAEEQRSKSQIQLENQTASTRASILANSANLINSIAGKETKAGFLLSKAAAVAQVLIADSQARAAATAAAAVGSIPTGGTTFGATKATLDGLITANTAISLGAIAASAIQGFQDGGIIPGSSNTGDRVLARVNSGEMILNRAQQSELFQLANGGSSSSRPIEVTVNSTLEVEDEVLARSVSRSVADGSVLGEFE